MRKLFEIVAWAVASVFVLTLTIYVFALPIARLFPENYLRTFEQTLVDEPGQSEWWIIGSSVGQHLGDIPNVYNRALGATLPVEHEAMIEQYCTGADTVLYFVCPRDVRGQAQPERRWMTNSFLRRVAMLRLCISKMRKIKNKRTPTAEGTFDFGRFVQLSEKYPNLKFIIAPRRVPDAMFLTNLQKHTLPFHDMSSILPPEYFRDMNHFERKHAGQAQAIIATHITRYLQGQPRDGQSNPFVVARSCP